MNRRQHPGTTCHPAIALVLVAAAVACSPLAPRPDPTQFYVLAPTAAESVGSVPGDAAVVLGPIATSAYLQRPQIATRAASSRIDYARRARWAEPLEDNVERVLASNLATLLDTNAVYTYPAFPAQDGVLQVSVRIERLERGANGEAEIAAQWTIREPKRGLDLGAHRRTITEAAAPDDMGASVDALSQALGKLSREIAQSIARVDLPPRSR